MKNVKEFPVQSVYMPERLPNEPDDSGIDLRALFSLLWRGKLIILICILFSGTIGFLAATQIEATYRASAKVMFRSDYPEIVDVGQLVGGVAVSEDTLQNEIEVLRSSHLVQRVVDVADLGNSPEFNPALRLQEQTVLGTWREAFETWLQNVGQDLGFILPPALPEAEPDPGETAANQREIVIQNVLSGLSLRPVPSSRVIEISFTSADPKTSALVANVFAQQYIEDRLDGKLQATRSATEWLSGRVDELRERVLTEEEEIENARARQSAEVGQSLEITQQQLQALSRTLTSTRNDVRRARATYERLVAALDNESDLGVVPEFRDARVIEGLIQDEADLLGQRATRVQLTDAPAHVLNEIDLRLEIVRSRMREEAGRVVDAARVEWTTLQREQQDIEDDIRDVETLALEQARDQVAVRQLEREAQANRRLYENFLLRLNETKEQERLTSADARVLSPATAPVLLQNQAEARTILLATIAGTMFGVGILFLLEKLNNKFRSIPEVEEITEETVLGSIPAAGRHLKRNTVLKRFKSKPKSSFAEAVRNLRTSILFSNVDRPPKVILFTSSSPREGKSTTATLTALASRQMGKSAIIVDCDLRLPALAHLLGGDDGKPGLLSAIDGNAPLEDCIYKEPDTGLHVLMSKPSEPRTMVNAADILSSLRFSKLLDVLKERYDLIVLDTPPTLPVADPRIMSAHADAVVYVVRWDKTTRGAVMEGLKQLRNINAPLAGLVLTMVNERKASRYAYEGYNYSRDRHKNYYVE